MPSTLVATPKDASANTYATRAEADTYFGDRLHASAWTSATTDQKDQALLWAAKILDTRVKWNGTKTTLGQAMDWPRAYVRDVDFVIPPPASSYDLDDFYIDADTVPNWLKWAQCEQALALLGSDISIDPGTTGYSAISVGSISLTIDKLDKTRVLPRPVRELVQPYGEILSGNAGSVKLLRA